MWRPRLSLRALISDLPRDILACAAQQPQPRYQPLPATVSGMLPWQRRSLSPGRSEVHVSLLLSPNEGTTEGLAAGWWCPVMSSQAAVVGGEGIQSKGVIGSPELLRKEAAATDLVCVLDVIHGILLLEVLLGVDPQREKQEMPESGFGRLFSPKPRL